MMFLSYFCRIFCKNTFENVLCINLKFISSYMKPILANKYENNLHINICLIKFHGTCIPLIVFIYIMHPCGSNVFCK